MLGSTTTPPPPPWTGKADGILLFAGPMGPADKMVRWIHRGGVPAVTLTTEWQHATIPIVSTDIVAQMRMAADYFAERGFGHIGFLADTLSPKDSARRRSVFETRVRKHGRNVFGYDLSFRPDGQHEDLPHMLEEKGLITLLRRTPKPMAFFCITDYFARALSELCKEIGLDVPNDVAILGSGDFRVSRCHQPTLSTIATDNDRIGFEAVQLLHAIIDGATPPRKPKLRKPLKIVERQSSVADYSGFGTIRSALDYIRQHACEGVNVADVVNVLSISRSTLENRFAAEIGRTPGQEIHRVRLERAKQLLVETDMSITQVAAMSGFNDLPPFTKFIKRELGISPRTYRVQARERQEFRTLGCRRGVKPSRACRSNRRRTGR